jgi:hypothetical protein
MGLANNGRPAPVDMRLATLARPLARALDMPEAGPPLTLAGNQGGTGTTQGRALDHNQARAYMDLVDETARGLVANGVGAQLGLTFEDLRALPLDRLMQMQVPAKPSQAVNTGAAAAGFDSYSINELIDAAAPSGGGGQPA